jgi:hypothetical protein
MVLPDPFAGNPDCPICHGTGSYQTGENDSKQCSCAFWKLAAKRMGPEIAKADRIFESPIYTPGTEGGKPIVDRSEENLFLKGYWVDLLPHFRLVLSYKLMDRGFIYNFLFTEDERLLQVWLGKESYLARSKKKRDDEITYNSLRDFIGEDQDLVVIRLGRLGYKNQAMPGVLKEALLIRQRSKKTTWLVEEPDSLFGPNNRSFNDEVGGLIFRSFNIIDLTGKETPRVVEQRGGHDERPKSEPGMVIDEDDPVPEPKPREVLVPSVSFDDDPIVNRDSKKSFKKKGWGR